MTQEEKARAYDEAIKKANKELAACGSQDCDATRQIFRLFPELKESEDEKIRKELIEHIKANESADYVLFKKFSPDDVIAWLEKHKPVEHLELKAGHWYICYRAFCCRADHLTVKEGERFMCEKDDVVKGFVIKDAEKYFKECNAPAPNEDEDERIIKALVEVVSDYPELDLVDKYGVDLDKTLKWLAKQGEQKPKWTEEDSLMIDSIIDTIKWLEGKGATNMKIDWLKSLKQRMDGK